MKFFTSDLWRKLNSTSIEEREMAFKQWKQIAQLYYKELACVLRKVSKREHKAISICEELHDCKIKGIEFTQNQKNSKWTLEIILEPSGEEKIKIMFVDVITFNTNIQIGLECILGNMNWGYCEFSLGEKSRLHMALLCDLHNEISIDFHSMKAIDC